MDFLIYPICPHSYIKYTHSLVVFAVSTRVKMIYSDIMNIVEKSSWFDIWIQMDHVDTCRMNEDWHASIISDQIFLSIIIAIVRS